MSTEIAKREVTGAVVATEGRTGAFQGDATDILVPRLFAAQKTSKIVDDDKAKPGQLVRSTTLEVLGGLGVGVPIIPLKHWKTWMITLDGKFQGLEAWTPANASYAFEFDKEGKKYRRERVLNFFVMLPRDIDAYLEARKIIAETGEMPDKVVGLTPCQIGFKSTSYKAGRALVTHFAQMEDLGAMPYMRWLLLDSEIQRNDKGSYAVLKVSEGGAVKSPDHKAACERWFKIVKGQELKVDDSDLDSEAVEVQVTSETRVEF